jgi:hypothetical protein
MAPQARVKRVTALARRWLAVLLMPGLLLACTLGEGEGPRFIGRVASVGEHELCLGPNTSSPTGACGSIPEGVTRLPRVGECVSLFGYPFDHGSKILWSRSDLNRHVDEKECSQASIQRRCDEPGEPLARRAGDCTR